MLSRRGAAVSGKLCGVERSGDEIRRALVSQWELLRDAIPLIDLNQSSRVDGWRNREVLAHLSVQPALLSRFIAGASFATAAEVSLESNLAGTHAFAAMIDAAAREAAEAPLSFSDNLDDALPVLATADLTTTITSFQGPIRLVDYLVTRCVEAVVHGRDVVEPIEPDPTALAIAADALTSALVDQHPELIAEIESLAPGAWLDVATGRTKAPPELAHALPVMT